ATEAFSKEALRLYFEKNRQALEAAAQKIAISHAEFAKRLSAASESLSQCSVILESPAALDLEDLERRLTVLDDKIHAAALQHANEELLLRLRREMDGQLALYRSKMRAEQIALVEKQFLHKRLLEEYGLPRLSLFYLQH